MRTITFNIHNENSRRIPVELNAGMLAELLALMETQDSSDRDVNTSVKWMGEHATYYYLADAEGNIDIERLDPCR